MQSAEPLNSGGEQGVKCEPLIAEFALQILSRDCSESTWEIRKAFL